jgi:hypothetical protein
VASGPAATIGCHQSKGYGTGKVSEHKGNVGEVLNPITKPSTQVMSSSENLALYSLRP